MARCLCLLGVRAPCVRKATRPPCFLAGRDAVCVLYVRVSAAVHSEKPAGRGSEGAFLAFCFPARARVPLSRPPSFVLLSRPHDLFRGRSEAARCSSERRLENYSQRAGRATLSFPALGSFSVFFGGNETGQLRCLVGAGHFLSQQGDSPAGLLRVSGPVAATRPHLSRVSVVQCWVIASISLNEYWHRGFVYENRSTVRFIKMPSWNNGHQMLIGTYSKSILRQF